MAEPKDAIAPQTNITEHITLAAEIVSAFVSNNSVPMSELPMLIENVHGALGKISTAGMVNEAASPEARQPAVPIKKSVTSEFIICLDDGKKFKSLKRHLRTAYDMTPQQYREKWGLKADYPMVAPAYAKARSELALQLGLGRKTPTTARTAPAVKRGRGRPKGAQAAA